ncbi:MAG: 23S rRNA (adenine(1618)-N(6))-methyltransferase RlmF [Bacteroidota bacterium]|nr:23S rRNA (adenine(1618)-N(6))-methyltransferase RlmF [Bacteroidota bacterium]
MSENTIPPSEKESLHPRNKHRSRYDFDLLTSACEALRPFVSFNKYNVESIDFANPKAVKALNQALLKVYYGIEHWDIPDNYLCPAIPGRADYIHYMADLLASCNGGKIPRDEAVTVLEIGIGASCVYPIIANAEYGWDFVASDIDPVALSSARSIVASNRTLRGVIEFRLQTSPSAIFRSIVQMRETYDLTICNPPFHSSAEEAQRGTSRKVHNLGHKKQDQPVLNFGGQNNELWCKGGEKSFIDKMIMESRSIPEKCFWFSTLVSKKTNLPDIYKALKKAEATDVRTINMEQGQKQSRIVAWTFLSKEQQKQWAEQRW